MTISKWGCDCDNDDDDVKDKEGIPPDHPMQICAKTLNFGTTTLEVKASDTVKHVKRKTRAKLEQMLEGFDVNMMVNFEDDLVFEGKQLDDERTLSDYSIQKDATLRFVHGLEGGGERARASVVESEMAVCDTDRDTVKACFSFNEASFKTWFRAMPTDKQLEFLRMAKIYKQNPDRLMNHAARLAPEVVAVEVWRVQKVCV